MTEPQAINWQPISALATVAHVVNELLANSEEQYATLAAARSKPHVLDDEIIDRIVRLYTERLQSLRLYRLQLDRWKQEQPPANRDRNATPQPADHTRQGTQPNDLGLSGLPSIGPYSTKRIAVILSISLCNSFNSLSPNRFSIQSRKPPAAMVAVPSSIETSRVLVSFLGKRSSGK